jgi:hypothetical protein
MPPFCFLQGNCMVSDASGFNSLKDGFGARVLHFQPNRNAQRNTSIRGAGTGYKAYGCP